MAWHGMVWPQYSPPFAAHSFITGSVNSLSTAACHCAAISAVNNAYTYSAV